MRKRFASISAPHPRRMGRVRPPGATPASRPVLTIDEAPEHPQMRARSDLRRCSTACDTRAPRRVSSARPPRCDVRRPRQARKAAKCCGMGVRRGRRLGARGRQCDGADMTPMRLILVRHGRPDEDDAVSPQRSAAERATAGVKRALSRTGSPAKASPASSPARCARPADRRPAGRTARPADRHDRGLGRGRSRDDALSFDRDIARRGRRGLGPVPRRSDSLSRRRPGRISAPASSRRCRRPRAGGGSRRRASSSSRTDFRSTSCSRMR